MNGRLANLAARALDRWAQMPWPLRWGLWIIGATAFLFIRWPQALLQADFYFEDGQTFYLATYFGSPLEVIFRPYVGYLHMVPRLVAYLERAVPVASAPFVAALITLLITAAIAAYIASDRMAGIIPSRGLRWLLAIVFLSLANHDAIGTIHNLQWYLAIFLFCAALASPAKSFLAIWAERIVLVIVSLTGPFSIVMAPLFILRAIRARNLAAIWSALIVTIGAVVQLLLILIGHRHQVWGYTLNDLIGVFSARIVAEPIIGVNRLSSLEAAQWPVPVVVLAIALLMLMIASAASRLPRDLVLAAAYAGGTVALLGLTSNMVQASAMLNPGESRRYFILIDALIAAILISGAAIRGPMRLNRILAIAGAVLLSVNIASNFFISPWPVTDWAGDSACIGRATPCVVPMPGAGQFMRWPGIKGQYNQNLDPPP